MPFKNKNVLKSKSLIFHQSWCKTLVTELSSLFHLIFPTLDLGKLYGDRQLSVWNVKTECFFFKAGCKYLTNTTHILFLPQLILFQLFLTKIMQHPTVFLFKANITDFHKLGKCSIPLLWFVFIKIFTKSRTNENSGVLLVFSGRAGFLFSCSSVSGGTCLMK